MTGSYPVVCGALAGIVLLREIILELPVSSLFLAHEGDDEGVHVLLRQLQETQVGKYVPLSCIVSSIFERGEERRGERGDVSKCNIDRLKVCASIY